MLSEVHRGRLPPAGSRGQVLRGVAQERRGLIDMLQDLRADRQRGLGLLLARQLCRQRRSRWANSADRPGRAAGSAAGRTPSVLTSMPRTWACGYMLSQLQRKLSLATPDSRITASSATGSEHLRRSVGSIHGRGIAGTASPKLLQWRFQSSLTTGCHVQSRVGRGLHNR